MEAIISTNDLSGSDLPESVIDRRFATRGHDGQTVVRVTDVTSAETWDSGAVAVFLGGEGDEPHVVKSGLLLAVYPEE